VTFHEASQAHLLRQFSLYPILARGRHFIFTSQYEQEYVKRMAPWITGKWTVVPIGCNLPLAASSQKAPGVITCFSIVRPDKGLEDVLEMARLLQARGSLARVRIVGALMPRWTAYFARLRAESTALPVEWKIGLDDDSLSRMLAESALAYLPFPDGASERRSSLIAMLMNRACVLTTNGKHTPQQMQSCVVTVSTPAEAADKAQHLLAEPVTAKEIADRGAEYASRFSWESISRQHLKIYEQSMQ
jgi:glycosyltransferase involved in cell wall biosynthesis